MNNMPLIVSVVIGVILIIAHFLLGKSRSYLIYLGAAFIIFAPSINAEGKFRWMYIALAGVAILLAVYEALLESRDRLQQMRADQRDRELAFSELMNEMTRIDKIKREAKKNDMMPEESDSHPEVKDKQ